MLDTFFVGLGVQKCASTWLFDVLCDHPQVALSRRKEVDFFSYHYGKGFQWYEGHFPAGFRQKAWGEISPSYFVEKSVPERLRSFRPDAKLLVSLRDPVERAISNHRHEVRMGHFKGEDLSFEAGLRNNPLYLEQSRYGVHLLRWLEFFAPQQFFFVFKEDIDCNPIQVCRTLYEFLGLDPDHVPGALSKKSNESRLYRSQGVERARKIARQLLRRAGADGLWKFGQEIGLQKVYRTWNIQPPSAKIPVVAAVTERELRRVLEWDIATVESLTGRELAEWRLGRAEIPAYDRAPTDDRVPEEEGIGCALAEE